MAASNLAFAATTLHAGDTNIPPPDYELRVTDHPIVQRGFLPDVSARSIAVGLPGGSSYCFDAETCRLRYAWSGGFLDMKPTWNGRGASPPTVRGTKFFIAPETMSLRLGDRTAAPDVKFLGYRLLNRFPEFRFTVNGIAVKERIDAARDGGLRCTFELDQAKPEISFRAPAGVRVSVAGRDLAGDDQGWIKIPGGSPARFEVVIRGPGDAGPVESAARTANER